MTKVYRYRFYPTSDQKTLLLQTIGCVRLVYNKALAVCTEAWHEREERIDYVQTSNWLNNWKKQDDLEFLNEISSIPLQQGLKHLQKAFTNFWAGRAKYPNFQKKHDGGSAEFTNSAFCWKDGQLFLAKSSDPLAIRWSRPIPFGYNPSTITVKLNPRGQWFVSMLVDDHPVNPLPKSDKSIVLEMGITNLVATSNGDEIANPQHFERLDRKLQKLQKVLARKQKGSNNQHKTQLKVAKVYGQIADSRKDFLQKLTTQLVRENQTIVVEGSAIRNLVNHHKLVNNIADASWGELIRQLTYKCQWYGRELVKIDRGNQVDKLPLKMA